MNSWIQKLCFVILFATSCIGQHIKCTSAHPIRSIIKWGDPRMPKGYKLELLSQILQAIDYGQVINQNQTDYEECLYEDLIYVVNEIFSETLYLNMNSIITNYINQGSETFQTDLLRNDNAKLSQNKGTTLEADFAQELADVHSTSAKHFQCKCTETTCKCKHVTPHAIERLYGKFKSLKAKKQAGKYSSNKPNFG